MKNFIFKSEADFHKIVSIRLESLINEQKAQRIDLAVINRLLTRHINDMKLQKEVDDFYPNEDIPQDEDKEPD